MTDAAPHLDASPPTWDDYEALLERANRGPAYHEAAAWALTELRDVLGDDWLRRAAESERPPPLLRQLVSLGWHTLALAEVLEWALRLRLVRELPGAAKLRRDLVRNAMEGRTLHTALQLAVAAPAVRLGWAVALEPARAKEDPPADLLVAAPAGDMLIETRVRSESDVTREARHAVNNAMDRLFFIGAKHDVWIEGQLGRFPSESELDDIERCVAVWTSSDTAAAGWSAEGIALRMVPRHRALGRLTGPPVQTDSWQRLTGALTEKAGRMQRSGAQWLRILPLTGMWAFTSWATQPLERKLEDVVEALTETLGGAAPAGVVLSSGAALHGGDVPEESVVVGSAVAVRRAVTPLRARETLIVPLHGNAAESAKDWVALADAEADWLDWALARQGLPPLTEILEG
jgi:hypothetical protein